MVIYEGRSFKSQKVVILQKRLSKLPINPANPRLRKQRATIQKRLVEEARKSGDVSNIDLQAGTFS